MLLDAISSSHACGKRGKGSAHKAKKGGTMTSAERTPREFRPPSPYILTPRCQAPYFSGYAVMPDGGVSILSINDPMYSNKFVVLVFYVGDWTKLCMTELKAYSPHKAVFDSIRCEVIFCSTDSHFSHAAFLAKNEAHGGVGHLNYPLLGDRSQSIARSFGILNEDMGLAFRATFIINSSKKIRQILVQDLAIGRDVDETVRSVKAFLFTEARGSFCPANWEPTIQALGKEPTEDTDVSTDYEILSGSSITTNESGIAIPNQMEDQSFKTKTFVMVPQI